jgi:hypothetical protein
MKNGMQHIAFILLLTAIFGCKKPFEPAPVTAVTNFLVVDGNINIGVNIPTTIVLSRTKQLSDSILFDPETNAAVYIEQEQGGSYSLSHFGNGVYRSLPLSLVAGKRYRLRIQADNKEYNSAFEMARVSPAIDSLTWRQERMLRYRCTRMIHQMIHAIIAGIILRYGTTVPPWYRHGE